MIIGTAGHVDHGKTTLVHALTGVDTDRLKEEKSRGISIDLGFAYKRYADMTSLAFVDVPGHERFIRNMVAGASGIDFALLVVACNEGPKPQTHEHALVLKLLGIRRGVVVLTKADLADDERLGTLKCETAEMMKAYGLGSFPIIPVSAQRGLGLQRLEEHLRAEARRPVDVERAGRFRMPIDRSFALAGFGPIVTGTIWSGEIHDGQTLTVWPSRHSVRVRGVHADSVEVGCARAGERCALNLVGAGFSSVHARRGHWVIDPELDLPTSEIDVQLVLDAVATNSLVDCSQVQIYLATGTAEARIGLFEKRSMQPGEEGLARLLSRSPTLCFRGDRFLIRNLSDRRVIGGGTVLDPFPATRRCRKPERVKFLRAMENPSLADRLILLASERNGVDLSWFRAAHNLDLVQCDNLLQDLQVVRIIANGRDRAFERALFDQLCRVAEDEVRATLIGARSDVRGIRADDLRRRLALTDQALSALLSRLVADGRLVQAGGFIATPDYVPTPSEGDEALLEYLYKVMADKRYEPVSISHIAVDAGVEKRLVRDGMKRLARLGRIAFIGLDRVLPAPMVFDLARLTEEKLKNSHTRILTIAEFRALAGCGRNGAVALLEYFDRCQFTRRQGDGRRLVRPAAAAFPKKGAFVDRPS